ncbi:MAG: DinB family protein [Mucilaginibacter sp.]
MLKRTFHIKFGQLADYSLDYICGILQDTRTTTILSLKNLSVPELDWQYQDGWNTIGALLAHIIAIENYFRMEFAEGRKLTDEENAQLLPALDMGIHLPKLINKQPLEAYINQLTESRELMLSALAKLNHEDFTRRIEDYDEETGCNLAWVLYHMAEDEIYHRGQISIIRKLYKMQAG